MPFDQDNYAGFLSLYGDGNKEYIEVPLLDTLRAGSVYCIGFRYSHAGGVTTLTCDGIGVHFSIDSIVMPVDSFFQTIRRTPQVSIPDGFMMYDTTNWLLFSASFVAQGGEKFMTIGNYKNYSETTCYNIQNGPYNHDYIYIDSVSVFECGIADTSLVYDNNSVSIYPNPASTEITLTPFSNETTRVQIVDAVGRTGKTIDTNSHQAVIDVSTFPNGIYFLKQLDIASGATEQTKFVVMR